MTEETNINYEETLSALLKTSVSGTGEEELLRIASTYSLQITAQQIKALLFLEFLSHLWHFNGRTDEANWLIAFNRRWLELKENNNSDYFVMKALEHISLRKLINENTFKVNINK